MAGIAEAIKKKDNKLDFGIVISLKSFTDWKFKKVMKEIEVFIEEIGVTIKDLDYCKDLQIAKNLKVGDKVKLFVDSEYSAMWRKENEKTLDENVHIDNYRELKKNE